MPKLTIKKAAGVVLVVCGLSASGKALAVPFKVDLGLAPPARGAMNGSVIVAELKTGKVLEERKIAKQRFQTLNFPTDGFFSLEIKNEKGQSVWKETVYVVLAIPSSEHLMRSSWAQNPGVMRTVLRVQDPAGEIQYGVSIRDKIFLRLKAAPRLVRIFQEDYAGVSAAAQSLGVAQVTEKAAREEVAQKPLPEVTFELGDGADQVDYEPDYKGLLAGKEDKSLRDKIQALGGSSRLESLNRKHRVFGWVRLMSEDFRVRRETDSYNGEKTQGFGTGFGGDLVVKDTLSLQLEVDTHGTKTDYESGGTNAPAEEQKRVHLRFGPLFDILNINHKYPRFAFELGPVFGYTQIPLEKDNEGKTDFGASMRWQFFGEKSLVSTQLRWMKSHSRDLSLTWTGTGYTILSISPLFAVYNYHTEFDAASAKALFDESGIRFGIARQF